MSLRGPLLPTIVFFAVSGAGIAFETADIVSGTAKGLVCMTCHPTQTNAFHALKTPSVTEIRRERI
jgi:hypothetical protein